MIEKMAYVYKYVHKPDDVVVYVGIIKRKTDFVQRFREHKYDYWFCLGPWEIYYFKTETDSEAELLERHLINLYHTDIFFNKKKTSLGLCPYIDESAIAWAKFVSADKTLFSSETVIEFNALEKRDHELTESISGEAQWL